MSMQRFTFAVVHAIFSTTAGIFMGFSIMSVWVCLWKIGATLLIVTLCFFLFLCLLGSCAPKLTDRLWMSGEILGGVGIARSLL